MRHKRKLAAHELQGALFAPKIKWSAPSEFPDLSGVKKLGIDTETCDPDLLAKGPGFIRGNASVVGLSVATDDASWYFPIGHMSGGNMPHDSVVAWAKDTFKEDRWYVGANIQYDVEALDALGVTLGGRLIDVQIAEALIDEEQESYSLENISRRRLGVGKDETGLIEAAEAFGVHPKSELWKLHAGYVGPYAEADAQLPLKILAQQLPIMKSEDTLGIFEMESKLTRVLFKMRKNGVRINLDAAYALSRRLSEDESDCLGKLKNEAGFDVDVWSGDHIARVFTKFNLHIKSTEKGNPCFDKETLQAHTHPVAKLILQARELNRLRSAYVDDLFINNNVRGRVHCQWVQLPGDEGGARTGRMACKNPNWQQTPSRSDVSELIRALAVPVDGEEWWKHDYSQQEPRIAVHYAETLKLTGAAAIAMAYRNNKDTDIYQFLSEVSSMSRRDAKDCTLGRMYNMGVKTFANKRKCSDEEARRDMDLFDKHVPWMRELSDYVSNIAKSRGWIRTLGGRRRHFNLWEPANRQETRAVPRRQVEANAAWPNQVIVRAYTHKALNSLIQGSGADMNKYSMVRMHDELGVVPYLTVHDEIDHGGDKKTAMQVQEIMLTALKTTVPMKVDTSSGEHWK